MKSKDTPNDVNKRDLWGWWHDNAKWRDTLDRRLAYKALDIPEENDVNVQTKNGVGWKEMAVVGATLLGGGWMYGQATQETPAPTTVTPPVVQQAEPVDSGYDVLFYDAAGNQIDIPHVSSRTP